LTEILLGALLFVLVAAFVLVPLRRQRSESGEDPRIADLESRKEAKYREIRDTELDHAAGKLSDEDFRRQDAELRREAVEILNQLDEAKGEQTAENASGEEP
jgi:flagellar biosynthesis/type III secretory pathway M-ring protein FliF/YscJ